MVRRCQLPATLSLVSPPSNNTCEGATPINHHERAPRNTLKTLVPPTLIGAKCEVAVSGHQRTTTPDLSLAHPKGQDISRPV